MSGSDETPFLEVIKLRFYLLGALYSSRVGLATIALMQKKIEQVNALKK